MNHGCDSWPSVYDPSPSDPVQLTVVTGWVAQLVEHRTENPGVAGSIPAPAILFSRFSLIEYHSNASKNRPTSIEFSGFGNLRMHRDSRAVSIFCSTRVWQLYCEIANAVRYHIHAAFLADRLQENRFLLAKCDSQKSFQSFCEGSVRALGFIRVAI